MRKTTQAESFKQQQIYLRLDTILKTFSSSTFSWILNFVATKSTFRCLALNNLLLACCALIYSRVNFNDVKVYACKSERFRRRIESRWDCLILCASESYFSPWKFCKKMRLIRIRVTFSSQKYWINDFSQHDCVKKKYCPVQEKWNDMSEKTK